MSDKLNDTTAREFLFSWNDLNRVITEFDEQDINYLIDFELRHRNRLYILERLFQRGTVLKRAAEWEVLKQQHETRLNKQ